MPRSCFSNLAPLAQYGPVLLCLTLGACNTSQGWMAEQHQWDGVSSALSSYTASDSYTERQSIAPGAAIVRLGGHHVRILGVTEQRAVNGLSQHIVYPQASQVTGENFIEVNVVGARAKAVRAERLRLHSNRASDIFSEAKTALPAGSAGLKMLEMDQNRYGSYGLIMARTKGKLGCLFGWQTLLDPKTVSSGRTALDLHSGWPSAQGLSYRIRYCAKGLGEAEARALMADILLTPTFSSSWLGEPASVSPALSYRPAVAPLVTTQIVPVRPVPAPNVTAVKKTTATLDAAKVPHPDDPLESTASSPQILPSVIRSKQQTITAGLVPAP